MFPYNFVHAASVKRTFPDFLIACGCNEKHVFILLDEPSRAIAGFVRTITRKCGQKQFLRLRNSPLTALDFSMLTKWRHECRSYIAFCISTVAPRIALDCSCAVQSNNS